MVDPQLAFGVLKDSFARAADRCGASVCETGYIFAGQKARFRIVGKDLLDQIHQPFAHLKVDKELPRTEKLPDAGREPGTVAAVRARVQAGLPSSPHDAATRMVARLEMNIQGVYTIERSGISAARRRPP